MGVSRRKVLWYVIRPESFFSPYDFALDPILILRILARMRNLESNGLLLQAIVGYPNRRKTTIAKFVPNDVSVVQNLTDEDMIV
jgi:hypothetical protein